MKTYSGNEIPLETRAVVYFCEVDCEKVTIEVVGEVIFNDWQDGLDVYANTPNPASQLVTADTYAGMAVKLKRLHENLGSKEWIEGLIECL